ncbi:hypothetical protein MKX03_006460 [Papaver bracteatum]|nr:hypothetical protein MKX03_006460 [Papaver bracteatum]
MDHCLLILGISSFPSLYAHIIQVLDTRDETIRKSLKEELLKIIEEKSSKQNGETKVKVIDENGGLRVDEDKVDSSKDTDLGDRCVKCKIKHLLQYLNSLEERARLADGKEVHQVDYMSPKPWYPERIVKPLGPYLTW